MEETGEESIREDSKDTSEEASPFPVFQNEDDDLPPKVGSPEEELVDGVTKQIIKEGQGDTPQRHATCFVHYRAWTVSTMHKFQDTRKEQQVLELVLGHEKEQLRGLAIAVTSMKAGESALFKVGWKLGYGKEGNFSFPNVPPMADLVYEVELIGFENAREGRPRAEMTVEERIEAADRRRVDGNDAFKEDKVGEAMQKYEMALAYMGDDFMFQLFGKYKDMANAVKNPCHLNMAACLLRLEQYEEAIGQCNVVLAEDENNVKALFRRGKAQAALGRTDNARADFNKVKALAPNDKAVLKELKLIAQHDKELYEKQRQLYKGLFGPPPLETPSLKRKKWVRALIDWFLSLFRALKLGRRKSE
ncbi:peptidyl-prolyl cis-trans isomerase FKBP42 [Selaginella moellendorffii]|uniref:peptidyl-prolyl cis-trans isomerase FKBP42 n=1 Tax=Selaginella moellendorffii TaxID=88036 RepID=UPI000D1D0132|nr:peptidyl-prolyl cis-trans isomerase FKBP42 [Selaginella moellendorffii]|eukprot:XP_002962267.2 peptidyl-prolyl cis-trans isomerase FKBP42 [Selaginella moellendorffii]